MKKSFFCWILLLLYTLPIQAQSVLTAAIELGTEQHSLDVRSQLTLDDSFQTHTLYLYDWNYAYHATSTPLGQRFSDEFVRSFYFADDKERSNTTLIKLQVDGETLVPERLADQPDILRIELPHGNWAGKTLDLDYVVQLPHARFGRYGYTDNQHYYLTHFLLRPARYIDQTYKLYSNHNIDDAYYQALDLRLAIRLPEGFHLSSNAQEQQFENNQYVLLSSQHQGDLSLEITPTAQYGFKEFNVGRTRIRTNFHSADLPEWQQVYSLTQLAQFVEGYLGPHPLGVVQVTQMDYAKNPYYGLNQLPKFLRPFEAQFLYEIQFLKAYLRAYVRTAFDVDMRQENAWVEGLQIYLLRQYVEQYYPEAKLIGRLSKWWLLQGFYLSHLQFNQQYTYYSQLMARKNLDQPLGTPKDDLLKFNQQIANPYQAGLHLRNLEHYIGKTPFRIALRQAVDASLQGKFNRAYWQKLLEYQAGKSLDWYFNQVYDSREVIDYRIVKADTKNDSTYLHLRNVGGISSPIQLYAIDKNTISQRQWLEGFAQDTTVVVPANWGKTWVLNLEDITPEFNPRDNWYRQGKIFNRPVQLTFMKDVEFPHVQQLLWVPNFEYNLYDGFSPGLRLHNRTILDKRFSFDIIPTYSIKTGEVIGSGTLVYNHYRRNSNWYYTRFSVSGNYFHYAPEATYTRWNPMIQWRYRPDDLRKNTRHLAMLRYVMVDRQTSPYALDDYHDPNYNVLNFRWSYAHDEIQKTVGLTIDNQWSPDFIKQQLTGQYSTFFAPNRQWSIRAYAGVFWRNTTHSDFFSFGLHRPSDYLFDFNYYGRSEDSGLFSQQFIKSEAALKTIRPDGFANQWMSSINSSITIWNWIEAFADAAWYADRGQSAQFAYDTGIRLNLVPDYFELYFPLYSENGWVGQGGDYSKQVRFVVTIDPKTLINLATRRWW